MNIDLKLYNTLSADGQLAIREVIISNYDTKMSCLEDPEEWLASMALSLGLWVVTVNGQVAGLFAIRTRRSTPDSLQCTTFLLKEFRGAGVNLIIKRSVAMACLALGIPLVALVQLGNEGSKKAMAKAFPSVVPEMQPFSTPEGVKIHLWLYDLRKLRYSHPVASGVDIYNAIHHWAASTALKGKGFK